MEDRHAVRGAPLRGVAIEIVVEDGFDRAVGPRADLEGARGGRLDALGAERLDQPDDAETGAEALLGMRPVLQDQLAQRPPSPGRSTAASRRMRSIVQSA